MEYQRCIAIKYNGSPCPCRAKYGQFCGRHCLRCKDCGTHFPTQNDKDSHYCPSSSNLGRNISFPPTCIESNNFLWKLIFKYPRKKWFWQEVSSNSCTTLDIIECFINEPHTFKFSWEDVSRNPNLTVEFIKKHPYKRWNWRFISENSSFTPKDVENNPEFPWEPGYLVLNKSFPEEEIEKVIDNYSWQRSIWENNDLSLEFIKYHSRGKRLNWRLLSLNKNITPEFIESKIRNPFVYWHRLSSSYNINLTNEFFERHSEDHHWEINFGNPIFDKEFIEKHAEEKWFWEDEYGFREDLLYNPDITLELLKKYQKLQEVGRYVLSNRLRLTWEDVESNPNITWDYNGLAKNCKIPIEKINHLIDPSYCHLLSLRCNNKEDYIEKYLDFWIVTVSKRNFDYNPKIQRIIKERQEIMEKFGIVKDISNLIVKDYEGMRIRNWTCYYCDQDYKY
jgi:hypothetical protein